MGSGVRLPRAARRAQLLQVATVLFVETGYRGTSMDDIASAAGVTKPVLYQHYSSKENLFIEVVRAVGDRMVHELDALAEMRGDTRARTAAGLESFVEVLASPGMSMRLFETSGELSPEVQDAVQAVLERSAASLASTIQRSRDIDDETALVLGRVITEIARGSVEQLAAASRAGRREHVAAVLAAFIEGGLRAFRPREVPGILGTVTGAATSTQDRSADPPAPTSSG